MPITPRHRWRGAGSLVLVLAFWFCFPQDVRAFKEAGHRSIEAAAYEHLIMSGKRDVLIGLIKAGMLRSRLPHVHPEGLADPDQSHFSPMIEGDNSVEGVWLGSHLPDHSFEHQFESNGQCYHFMARANDVVSLQQEVNGLPERLSKDAYTRCMYLLDILIRGIVFDPAASSKNGADLYTLIHIIEDSFSEAHTARTVDWRIEYLKPWRLRTWSTYVWRPRGWQYHLTDSHHGVSEPRDLHYLAPHCEDREGVVVSRECLTPRALMAADAIAELLILLSKHADCHERKGVERHQCEGFDADWNAYKTRYLSHADPTVTATQTAAPTNMEGSDLVGPNDVLYHEPSPNLGVGLITDFAESSRSLWLTGDVFVTRNAMKAEAIGFVDLLSYAVQLRLPIETSDGQRPAGVATELGIRIPINLMSWASQDVASLYLGVRARVALMASRASDETRFVLQSGFSGGTADLVLFRHVWLGFEGPRAVWEWDSLGPDRFNTYWSVKAGVALNAF